MSRSRWIQGEVQHLWDPMVGIPTPLERGCGRLSYAGLGCSYDGHRKGSHPMCEGALNYTCEGYAQSFDLQLDLAIYLGVEGYGFGELGVQQWLEARPKCVEKYTIPIWDNGLWDSKVYLDSFKEELSSGLYCDALLAGNQNRHLRKSINNHKNTVVSLLGGRED